MRRDDTNPACEHARELLANRLEGALSPADEHSLDEHLISCEACRNVASWIGDVDALSAAAPLPEATATELESLEAAVMKGIRAGASRPAPRRIRRRSALPRWFLPSAAAAATVAFLSWWQLDRGDDPLQQPQPVSESTKRLAPTNDPKASEAAKEELATPEEEQDLSDHAVDTVEEAVARQSGVVARDGELHVRGGRSGELSFQAPAADRLEAAAEKTDQAVENTMPVDEDELTESSPSTSPSPAAADFAQIRPDATAEQSTLDLRSAFRRANENPTSDHVAQLLDAWSVSPLEQPQRRLQGQRDGSAESQRAKLRADQFADPQFSAPSASFADSLRTFLEKIAEDPEHVALRSRVLRLLAEIPDSRE